MDYARENIRVVAIVQARMGSTRFPGKVLKPVAGKPLLWHIIHRLKKCHLLEEIAVATSVLAQDEAIVQWCNDESVTVVRGPEDNVLERYAHAAELLDPDIIVRVSSDAPFVDAAFIDHLVATLIETDGDYVLLEEGALCAHEGVDPFTRRALDKLIRQAGSDPAAREHVTGYFKLHPEFVKVVRAAPYPALAKKAGRLTVDTPDDLAFVEALHARMAAKAGEASLSDLLLLLEHEPELHNIHSHVVQKPIHARGRLALICCDGGKKFGYGHVKRMIVLARALRDRQAVGAVFALNGCEDAAAPIKSAGFEIVGSDAKANLSALIERCRPDLLILDTREGPSRAQLSAAKSRICAIAIIDDPSERRLAADYAYYPPVPDALALDWTGSKTSVRIGWEWSLLGLSPKATPRHEASHNPSLLVSMGGSDPYGLTLRVARVLERLDSSIAVRFVVGSGVRNGREIARLVSSIRDSFETIQGVEDLSEEYAKSDLAICAFGVSAYELAAFGIPAIYLSPTPDHMRSAAALADAGMGISLGLADQLEDEELLRTIQSLWADTDMRRQMSRTALALIDSQGSARIAAELALAVHNLSNLVTRAG